VEGATASGHQAEIKQKNRGIVRTPKKHLFLSPPHMTQKNGKFLYFKSFFIFL